ncbi:MAG: GNAT family N-acetyltransferase [Candidatus Aminicenantes bacterium]|nr:GNAT family N-acetyltransferase [Candidatus Aminicenantes bacterium]
MKIKERAKKNSRFSFSVVSSRDAQNFWDNAPGASAFTEPAVLERLSQKVDWLLAAKGDVPVCLWPVCLPDGISPAIPEFCYYIGPVWNELGTAAPVHRWLADSTAVYEGFIAIMIQRYGKIRAQTPLEMTDVRVFDWWNYHEPLKPRFTIRPRYTACIRGLQSLSEEHLQANFRNKRRQILRGLLTQGVPRRSNFWTEEELLRLYRDVMENQQQQVVSKSRHEGILALCALVKHGRGEVIAFRDGQDQMMSAGLLLYGKNVANLVLCLTASKWRGDKITLWTMYSMLMAGKAKGMDMIDFNGANSPMRADDKHSYGARAELFFELLYEEAGTKSK